MKKLLELKQLDTEIRGLVSDKVELPRGVFMCIHLHYYRPSISIYPAYEPETVRSTYEIEKEGVVFIIDDTIDIEIAKDIIEKVNEVLQ